MSLRSRSAWLIRGMFRRRRLERDMDAEMRFHMAAYIEDHLRSGVAREEAERRARIEFGMVESLKEECREARGLRVVDELRQDVRYAARMLKKNVAFTAIATATLAVGIGINAAIFSVVSAFIIEPPPYPDAGRLVMLWSRDLKRGWRYVLSPADLADYRASNAVFDGIAGWAKASFTLGVPGENQRIEGGRVNANFFRVLGVAPALGRDFTPQDDDAGSPVAVLISYGLWQERFGAAPNIVGRTIQLDGAPATIIGVMPPNFQFAVMGKSDIWKPLALPIAVRENRAGGSLRAIARLKRGVSLAQARVFADAVARRLAKAYPATNSNRGAVVRTLRQEIDENVEHDSVLVLFAIVGCVLLIACTDVANLMFGRAAGRQKEIAVRLAIGAGRFRILRQLVTENVLLFLLGGGLGVLVAVSTVKWFETLLPDEVRGYLPNYGVLHVDTPVLLYILAVAVLTGLLFGLGPALNGARRTVGATLNESGVRVSHGARSARIRKALVVFEISLALVVLVTAGLLVKSMLRMYGVNPGFDPHDLVTAKIALAGPPYSEPARVETFYHDVLQRIRSSPGVMAAGASQYIPFCEFDEDTPYLIDGRPLPPPGEARGAGISRITPEYLRTLGVALVRGRFFSEQDRADTAPVILINRAMARREWPGADPIGRGVRLGNSRKPLRTVVGVVENVKVEDLKEPLSSQVYVPFEQSLSPSMYIVVRTHGHRAEAEAAIRKAAMVVDGSQPVYDFAMMDKRIAVAQAGSVIIAQCISLFAAIALFLAAIGIYGVMAYSVTTRHQEIGVRMALGAGKRDILSLVLRGGFRLTALGIGAGLLGSLGAGRLLESLLFQVRPTDMVTLSVVTLLLAAVAVLACYIPARRAVRVDPALILRCE